jgi:hypothetical protein
VIRQCRQSDFEAMYAIINDAAQAYRGVIPADRWKEPYMSRDYLQHEIDDGVVFWGYEKNDDLIGVMGIQAFRTSRSSVTLTYGPCIAAKASAASCWLS